MAGNQIHGTPLEDLSNRGPQNCMKIFVHRDYSKGTGVKFATKFPTELEGKIEKALFENTINQINNLFSEAEKMSCSRYCEGCFGCISAYLIFFCIETHYEQMMKKVAKYCVEQNERIWSPRGLLITNPVERGLRVIEVCILSEPSATRAQ